MTDALAKLHQIREDAWAGLQSTLLPAYLYRRKRRPEIENCGDCLMPLLRALDWRGDDSEIAESAPHLNSELDLTDLRSALVNLGYHTTPRSCVLGALDARFQPCLFEFAQSGEVCAVLGAMENVCFAYIGGIYRALTPDELACEGCAYIPSPIRTAAERNQFAMGWMRLMLGRFKPYFAQLFVTSLLSNVLAIANPIFVMVVYDKVIGGHSPAALPLLVLGILLALGADYFFRAHRAELSGRIAGRVDYILGVSTFAKLLKLPLAYTERPTVSSQTARLKEFESIREFFSGPSLSALIDFPFLILMLGAIAAIAGGLVVVPIVTIGAFAALAVAAAVWLEPIEHEAGALATERQNFLIDTAVQHQAVRREALEATWIERFRTLSAETAVTQSRHENRTALIEAITQLITNFCALGMLCIGALAVLKGDLSVGGLVAAMALTWRLLSPARSVCTATPHLIRMYRSTKQLSQMFRLSDEFDADVPRFARAPERGEIVLSRVSLRYSGESDPCLLGASLRAAPGAMVAIVGPNGGGKSTILKLVQGLYRPQAGRIAIDGTDLRQIPTRALRRAIAYVPQSSDMFYGTIAQNLRLADPLAPDDMLHEATRQTGIFDLIVGLPNGFETRIGDTRTNALPRGFLRRLAIARALVRPTPILLLDEPEQTLDAEGDGCLIALLRELKGKRTILMVSHRPSFIRLADEAVFVRRGMVEYSGQPDAALAMLGYAQRVERAA